MLKPILILSLFFSASSYSMSKFDKEETLNGIQLKSGKSNSVRTFSAKTEKTFSYPIELVKKGITNFTEKCNNSYKNKRKFTSRQSVCRYHNENLIETFIVQDMRPMEDFKKFHEVYLLGRQVYNRGVFGYYEMVTINESQNEKKNKVVTIKLRMLDDNEVKYLITPKFSRESAFDKSTTIFTLTAVSPEETHVNYEYQAETDHWLLNKEISVPQVFVSIGKNMQELIKTVDTESGRQKRELASKE